MILPDLVLPNRVNQCWQYSGMDSIENCLDKNHFKQYPHSITYNYNSRGFRDQEWPDSNEELKNSIWCVGDSFTVGLGSPKLHTWPQVLSKTTKINTINISMDGASNNWIARRAVKILNAVNPTTMVIHWSYLHRREGLTPVCEDVKHSFLIHYDNVRAPTWPRITKVEQFSSLPVYIQHELLSSDDNQWRQGVTDDLLRLWHMPSDAIDDMLNTQQCIELVETHCQDTKLIHSFIPGFIEDFYKSSRFIKGYQEEFYQKIKTRHLLIPEFSRLDLARDGHHYDIKTSENFVQQILQGLS
jgi:hypothetical protein